MQQASGSQLSINDICHLDPSIADEHNPEQFLLNVEASIKDIEKESAKSLFTIAAQMCQHALDSHGKTGKGNALPLSKRYHQFPKTLLDTITQQTSD